MGWEGCGSAALHPPCTHWRGGLARTSSLLRSVILGVVGPSSSPSAVSHRRISIPASVLYESRISFYFAAWEENNFIFRIECKCFKPLLGGGGGWGLWAPELGETLTRRKHPCKGLLGPAWVRGCFAGCASRGSAVQCWNSRSWASPSL